MSTLATDLFMYPHDRITQKLLGIQEDKPYGAVRLGPAAAEVTVYVNDSDTASRIAGAFSDLSALLLDREQKADGS